MSEVVVGLLGFACIVAIVVTLFKSKTLPSIAFIIFPMILGAILVFGGYYSWENIGKLIKSGFSSTGPTAALFVFSVLYFGIMTDAGMFDVIIGKLMLLVKDNVIGVCVMTCIIALIGHLDGGGASTFCIVVPAMLPVYKKMHMPGGRERRNPYSRPSSSIRRTSCRLAHSAVYRRRISSSGWARSGTITVTKPPAAPARTPL